MRAIKLIAFSAVLVSCVPPADVKLPDGALRLEDAERFADLYAESEGRPTATLLRERYLDPGSEGVAIFTPHRIIDATNLVAKIAANPDGYRKALNVCLPAARDWAPESKAVLDEIAGLLAQSELAPAYALFGGDNSGGTADARGLVLGLEVLCRFADTDEEARAILEDFVAHEIVHVYQVRAGKIDTDAELSLLQMALYEGFADFIAERALGRVSAASADRTGYGEAHEADLWREFTVDLGGEGYGAWLYHGPSEDRPADLGYWIGKRICEAYYDRAGDKEAALQTLLALEDAEAILAESRYADQF